MNMKAPFFLYLIQDKTDLHNYLRFHRHPFVSELCKWVNYQPACPQMIPDDALPHVRPMPTKRRSAFLVSANTSADRRSFLIGSHNPKMVFKMQ